MQSGEDDISAFLFCADQAMKNACFSASDKESIRKWHEIMQGCQARKKNRSQLKPGSQTNFQPNQRRPNLSGGGRGGTLRGAMSRRPGKF